MRHLLRVRVRLLSAFIALLAGLPVFGGEIPGMPPPRLPTLDPVAIEIYSINDNMGRGKDIDDFRTEQMAFALSLGERWVGAVDYSILTLDKYANEQPKGRLDQISASLGYRLFTRRGPGTATSLTLGGGFRATDNFGGARIQNGFHQLVDDRIVDAPYVDTNDTDGAAWLRAEHAAPLPWLENAGDPGGWRWGYWLHGSTAVTTDGQSDGVVLANLTLSRGLFDAWLGLRGDWRSGYDQDRVQSAAANNEEGGYVTAGLRFGPILAETVQGFNADKAFGRISLFGGFGDSPRSTLRDGASGLTVGVTIPRAQLLVQGRTPLCGVFGCGLSRRWRLVGDVRYGKPAAGTRADKYIRATQATLGIEFADRPASLPRWVSAYASASAGWRQEEFVGELALDNQESSREGSAVLMGEAGVRLALQPPDDAWRLQAQVGLNGWLPADSTRVDFAGGTERVLKPDASLLLGLVLDF
jgi:hypothetical protein